LSDLLKIPIFVRLWDYPFRYGPIAGWE